MRRSDITVEGEGLIGIRSGPEWDGGLWTSCITRKPFECVMTGKTYPKGTKAFRPIGNGMNRMKRLAFASFERALVN